jgi:hypothetical protein
LVGISFRQNPTPTSLNAPFIPFVPYPHRPLSPSPC